MERRSVVTLGIAVLAHAIGWVVIREPSPRVDGAHVDEPSLGVIESLGEIELEPAPTVPPPKVDPAPTTMPNAPAGVHDGTGSKLVAIGVPSAPAPSGAASDAIPTVTVPGPEASAGGEPIAKPKIPSLLDLDSPGSHAVIFPSGLGSASEPSSMGNEVAAAKKLDAQLKGALDAKDTENGSGFGGPVVSAAHAAAGPSSVLGWATFDVSTDSFGTVTRVKLVDWGGDEKQWQGVAKDLDAAMGGKKLKVPTGAGGVSVRVKVSAAMKLPSGASKPLTPFVGAGSVGGEFDVADIGAKPKRMVAVQIVAESRI